MAGCQEADRHVPGREEIQDQVGIMARHGDQHRRAVHDARRIEGGQESDWASSDPQRLRSGLAGERLTSLAASLKRKNVGISTKVAVGRPATELIKKVLRSEHDLLIKVAEPDPGSLFGSTDMRLLRDC